VFAAAAARAARPQAVPRSRMQRYARTVPGTLLLSMEGARALAGLRSGDGPLSVRARPSSIKRDCDPRTTSSGGNCLVNVHAKSRLIPETSTDTPVRRQGPGRSLPGPDAGHPLHSAGGQRVRAVVRNRWRRARCVPDRPVNIGYLRSLPDSLIHRLTWVQAG
jgi:hypothetical protein